MNRRELILLLAGALTAARDLRAQQKAMPVIGYLSSGSPGLNAPIVTAFRQGLSETSAGREPNAPSLGERVLALATGKTRQELYLACPNDRPNHIGIAVQRHLRAGRIQERDGKLYATSPAAHEIA
jgi:hypothetical protein